MEVLFNRLDRAYERYKEEYLKVCREVLESGWYVLGENVKKFEEEFASFIGAKYCVGVNSGLDALILAFRALGIGHGDEVIVPANTYIASVLGITHNGATPVFVEPDEFYTVDVEKIEEKITKKTKAILAVHLYGQAACMDKIRELADKYRLYVVEDCAQSHGAIYKGKMTGSWGDVGCFSFYPTKNMGAFGDGGAITTDSAVIADKVMMLRNYGSKQKYYHEIEGFNSRLDEIQAAILRIKLKHYAEIKKERQKIASKYIANIKNNNILLPSVRAEGEHVWHLFVVRVEEREKFINYLKKEGIQVQIHYPVPPHLSGAYRSLGYREGDFPITEEYARTVVSIPLYEGMKAKEVEYVIDVINSYN